MPKPKMTMDALAVAMRAYDESQTPKIEDLRPEWFSRADFQSAKGIGRKPAEKFLNTPMFERKKCIIGYGKGWAYRLKP